LAASVIWAAAKAFLLSLRLFARKRIQCLFRLCLLLEVAKNFPLSTLFKIEYRKIYFLSTPKKGKPSLWGG
jgi:hypothetical protein